MAYPQQHRVILRDKMLLAYRYAAFSNVHVTLCAVGTMALDAGALP